MRENEIWKNQKAIPEKENYNERGPILLKGDHRSGKAATGRGEEDQIFQM